MHDGAVSHQRPELGLPLNRQPVIERVAILSRKGRRDIVDAVIRKRQVDIRAVIHQDSEVLNLAIHRRGRFWAVCSAGLITRQLGVLRPDRQRDPGTRCCRQHPPPTPTISINNAQVEIAVSAVGDALHRCLFGRQQPVTDGVPAVIGGKKRADHVTAAPFENPRLIAFLRHDIV